MSQAPESSWHGLSADEALARLGADPRGLSAAEAARRLAESGPNVVLGRRAEPVLVLLLRQVNSPLVYVLLVSAAVALAMGKVVDAGVVLGVVVANTVIGFVQEFRAGRAIAALAAMVPESARVLREGRQERLPAADLVPGDVVLLEAGDKVPADLRLLAARNLRADEAALTGESLPVAKQTEPCPEEASLGDRRSLAFGGTLVTSGAGRGVVVSTGASTELGRISAMLDATTELETPLTRAMAKFGRVLSLAIVAVAVALVAVARYRGYPFFDALLAGVTLAVAAIPEGLPAVITMALAIGVQRMARRRAIVRRLPAVETLGSTAVVCSDKTGTLTRNEMTVRALWSPSGAFELTGVGYDPEGGLAQGGESIQRAPADVRELLVAAALCNDAALRRSEEGWAITGDPTEAALLVAAAKIGLDLEAARASRPRRDAIPFESERQYMATLHERRDEGEGGRLIYLKGAPEVLLPRCERLSGGAPLDPASVLATVESMAERGLRVLAVASRPAPPGASELAEADAAGGFELLGLEGMIDPPRPEAIEAIRACREAGIAVKMITGDHKTTARAIGEQLGLLSPGEAAVSGATLAAADTAGLEKLARGSSVFARVAPEHKLALVRALQADGSVVAMTGDGVNDAPALKQSDIGVAMGITGTSVAKETADIVLTDDNFATIRAAVEEGRRVYDNLVKALAFLLPTNLGEALVLLVAVLFFPIGAEGPLVPMTPVQILWINLVASVSLSLPLAFEAMEPDVMKRPPRHPKEPILSRFVVYRTVVVAVLMTAGAVAVFLHEYFLETRAGVPRALAYREAQTMAVTTVVLFQIVYVLSCRSLKGSALSLGLGSNPWIYVGIGGLFALQVAFVHLPAMNAVFGTAPLAPAAWLKCALAASFVLLVVSLEKWWRRRRLGGLPRGIPA